MCRHSDLIKFVSIATQYDIKILWVINHEEKKYNTVAYPLSTVEKTFI